MKKKVKECVEALKRIREVAGIPIRTEYIPENKSVNLNLIRRNNGQLEKF